MASNLEKFNARMQRFKDLQKNSTKESANEVLNSENVSESKVLETVTVAESGKSRLL